MASSATLSPSPAASLPKGQSESLYAPPLADLFHAVQSLRGEVVSTGVATLALWKNCIHNERFRAGAENLAQYLALRHHDLSGLQPCLSAYGLTSLGRSEARVLTALDALLASLGRLSGLATPDYPPLLLVSDGERALHEEQNHILGRDPEGAKSLIMVTLPTEAATDAELVRRLLTAGANCVRINCAHDDERVLGRHDRRRAIDGASARPRLPRADGYRRPEMPD